MNSDDLNRISGPVATIDYFPTLGASYPISKDQEPASNTLSQLDSHPEQALPPETSSYISQTSSPCFDQLRLQPDSFGGLEGWSQFAKWAGMTKVQARMAAQNALDRKTFLSLKWQTPVVSDEVLAKCRDELARLDYSGMVGWSRFAIQVGLSEKSARLAAQTVLSREAYLKLGWNERINRPADIHEKLRSAIANKDQHGEKGLQSFARELGMSPVTILRTAKDLLTPREFMKLKWNQKIKLPADFKEQLEAGIATRTLLGDIGLRRISRTLAVDAQWIRRCAQELLEPEQFKKLGWSTRSYRRYYLQKRLLTGIATRKIIGLKGWSDFAASVGLELIPARSIARDILSPASYFKLGWTMRSDTRKYEDLLIGVMGTLDKKCVEVDFGVLIVKLAALCSEANPAEARELANHAVRLALARWRLGDQQKVMCDFVAEQAESHLRQVMQGRHFESQSAARGSHGDDEFDPLSIIASQSNPEAEAMAAEENYQLEAALSCLDLASRSVLQMIFYDEMSQAEVAEELGMTATEVGKIYKAALITMHQLLTSSRETASVPKAVAVARRVAEPIVVLSPPVAGMPAAIPKKVSRPSEIVPRELRVKAFQKTTGWGGALNTGLLIKWQRNTGLPAVVRFMKVMPAISNL